MTRRLTALLLSVLLLFTLLPLPARAADAQSSIDFYMTSVPSPGYGAEWGVLAACAGGRNSRYGAGYLSRIQTAVQEAGGQLDSRKSTETSRVILAVTAAGADASQLGGYDLTAQLNDLDFLTRQGVNGAIFALLALDCGNYTSAMREPLLQYILDAQLDDGGWVLSGEVSDTDLTAMALQALAPYQSRTEVASAVEAGLRRLSALQKSDGGFASYGTENCESCAQVILALCQLGIALEDSRFVRNGRTVLDAMQSYRLSDGSYRHLANGEAAEMASSQAALALRSLELREAGQPGIYTMRQTFGDLSGHWAAGYVQDAVHHGIFTAADAPRSGCFDPDQAITRSDVLKALWRASGAPRVDLSQADRSWKPYPHMVWARQQGVIDSFDPSGVLTRAQLCTMLWRLSGEPDATAASKAGRSYSLSDLSSTPSWADTAMGWALKTGLINGLNGRLAPNEPITRAQAATLLLRYLEEIA